MQNNSENKLFAETLQFIRQAFGQPRGTIPLHAPVFGGNEKKYLGECIDSTYVSSVGRFVDRFEEEMARFTGAAKAVVCVNGTNALHLALHLAGLERDEEVITQPLTFVATVNAIAYGAAHPVFVDVDRDTMGLSPAALRAWLEQNVRIEQGQGKDPKPGAYNVKTGRRIAAVVPMHTFGHPCRIDETADLCKQYHIELIEDAAESLGSYYKGQHTGTFGKMGVLSFNGNKILTTGGGGMLLFRDEALAKRAKHISTQAKVTHPWAFVHDEIGYNYRMPNINAALGLAQLEQLETFLAAKRKLAGEYKQFFEGKAGIRYVEEPRDCRSNFWLNAVLLDGPRQRDAFLEYTNQRGVSTRPAWELMHRLPMFKNAQCGDLSNAEWIAGRLVNIPSSVPYES
ncbi:MAG: putative pyridoxal phosphate-dependent aminotransferase EpsN [Candidatus Hydrogenedentes bacterium ADurb.Bin170]|nr:MAG: putative pyridoxal phosphate-dependent aminotransferase EpsN [Candidatus Hydrogenedentes bacterium ADurb.Bin170]